MLVEDRLFATLDPTVRRLRLPQGLTVLLGDTVGFIHKLPHQLVEAFKSTLEQVRTADLLLHVVDVSHPTWPEQVRVTEAVLAEIGAGEVPVVDGAEQGRPADRGAAGRRGAARRAAGSPARTATGLPGLLARIESLLDAGLARIRCELPSERGDVVALLRRSGRIVEEYYRDGVVDGDGAGAAEGRGPAPQGVPGSTTRGVACSPC